MSTTQYLNQAAEDFKKATDHLKQEYGRLQIGRANPSLIENLQVEAYGTRQPLKGLASITVPDVKTLQIQPWDKSVTQSIEKAIINANLNLNPIVDGAVIRINIPALTQERRQELGKLVHKMAEESRIAVRNIRQTINTKLKEGEKNKEITEDELHVGEKKLQERVDEMNKEIEEMAKKKEEDVMRI